MFESLNVGGDNIIEMQNNEYVRTLNFRTLKLWSIQNLLTKVQNAKGSDTSGDAIKKSKLVTKIKNTANKNKKD